MMHNAKGDTHLLPHLEGSQRPEDEELNLDEVGGPLFDLSVALLGSVFSAARQLVLKTQQVMSFSTISCLLVVR